MSVKYIGVNENNYCVIILEQSKQSFKNLLPKMLNLVATVSLRKLDWKLHGKA